jgi:hypothetical protein
MDTLTLRHRLIALYRLLFTRLGDDFHISNGQRICMLDEYNGLLRQGCSVTR